jgi:hypothetical protein
MVGATMVRERTRKEEFEDMELARDDMNDALREQYDGIFSLVCDDANTQIQHYWQIGKVVDDILDNETKYGSDALKRLVAAMGKQTLSYFHRARNLYQLIDEIELRKILSYRRKYSKLPVTLSHLSRITGVTDQRKRLKLLTDLCEQEQSFDEFVASVDKTLNRTIAERNAGGRKHKVPVTAIGKVSNFCESARFVCARADQVWLNEDYLFSKAISETAPDKVTPELIETIDQAIGCAVDLESAAKKIRNEAGKARELAAKIAATHAEQLGYADVEGIE